MGHLSHTLYNFGIIWDSIYGIMWESTCPIYNQKCYVLGSHIITLGASLSTSPGLFIEIAAYATQTITKTTNDCYCYGLGHMGSNPGKQTMVNKRELTSL